MADESALESQIAEWRERLRRQGTPGLGDLENRLRDEMAALQDAGLADDEAFLVAIRRLAALDTATREFSRTHAERLFVERGAAAEDADAERSAVHGVERGFTSNRSLWRMANVETVVVFGLAAVAALSIKVPDLFGYGLSREMGEEIARFYVRNNSFFVLPMLAAYFVWKRGFELRRALWLVLAFAAAAVFANVFPFEPLGSTEILTWLHLPILLWLVVGVAYAGPRWLSVGGRMDFVRFSGDLFIYYVLIALGGGVFTAFTWGMFAAIGLDATVLVTEWLLPCGANGAVIVGAWMVERRHGLVGSIAPMLARIFTPLFAVMLLAFLAAMVETGRWMDLDREMLIGFDLLLVVVLGLLLFSISARDPHAPPNAFDALPLLLVIVALAVDLLALASIAARISEYGFSANKTAALGENLILLANLAWSAWLYARFLAGRGAFTALERWQTAYVPIYAVWLALVVVAFPPLFGYA